METKCDRSIERNVGFSKEMTVCTQYPGRLKNGIELALKYLTRADRYDPNCET